MATTKVGVYRRWCGPIPKDRSGQPLPRGEWPKRRAHRWLVRWFGLDGKRYGKAFETRKEAEQFVEGKQIEVHNGKGDPPPSVTLKEYKTVHAEVMKGHLARSTFNLHLKAIDLLAEHVGWERPLHRISTREVEQFRAARLATGHSPSSANRELRSLKRIFNLAIMRGYLAPGQNPCLALPRIKVGRQRNAYCSPAEFQTILRAAPDGLWRAFLVLVYSTGLRLREATNLTWKDVEFQPGQVHVTRKAGGSWVQPWQPKDHEMRSVPLPEQAVSLLAAWQAAAPEECPYVFMEHGRWEYYRRQVSEGRWRSGLDLVNNLLRRFKTICRRAGVGPYTIHDMRRSCITNWARRLPIHVVQQLAGHSEIQTTETYYLSVHEDDLAKARKVQSELVGELPESRPTDTKLTQKGQNRGFPQKRGPVENRNLPPERDLSWRPQEESNL